MKHYALVKSGKIENIILADDDFAAHVAPQWDAVVRIDGLPTTPAIGWNHDGQNFIKPESTPVSKERTSKLARIERIKTLKGKKRSQSEVDELLDLLVAEVLND